MLGLFIVIQTNDLVGILIIINVFMDRLWLFLAWHWNQSNKDTNQKPQGREEDGDKPLIKGLVSAANKSVNTGDFDNEDLNKNCDDNHPEEDIVGVDIVEDIKLFVDFSGIEFVEHLHENKEIEDNGVMRDGAFLTNIKDILACIKDGKQ